MNRVAQALRHSNCQAKDRVLIALPDSQEFVASFFAAAKIGAIAVPVNPMARSTDYRHYIENSGARIAIVDAPILGEFAEGAGHKALDLLVICNQTPNTERPDRIARQILAWDDWLPTAPKPAQKTSRLTTRLPPIPPFSSTPPAAAAHRKRPCTAIRTCS